MEGMSFEMASVFLSILPSLVVRKLLEFEQDLPFEFTDRACGSFALDPAVYVPTLDATQYV